MGTATFGAILNTRLASYLADSLGDADIPLGASNPELAANNIQAMQALEEPIRGIVLGAYTNALTDLFLLAVPVVVFAFVISLFLKEMPLRSGASVGEAKAAASIH